jgi:hypothetical protein
MADKGTQAAPNIRFMNSLLGAITVLAIVVSASPARAYVVEVATSIPVANVEDAAQLEKAIHSMVDDVLKNAIAFTPTVITLHDARVIGDRIYMLLVIADADGEATIKALAGDQPAP